MNGEPPEGDELQRMLVTMKQNVLDRAPERRPRRVRRRVGIGIAVVAFLAVGTASGAIALGMVPHPFVASAPTDTAAPTPSWTEPAAAPITDTPSPTPTTAPTATRGPYSITDPSTWTISFTEVGPVAIGAPYAGEVDDLASAYTPSPDCPTGSLFERPGAPSIYVDRAMDGTVDGVAVSDLNRPGDPVTGPAPRTAEGMGTGSTLAELQAVYPTIRRTGAYGADPDGMAFSYWTLDQSGHVITFEFDGTGTRVDTVWVSDQQSDPPDEFCG